VELVAQWVQTPPPGHEDRIEAGGVVLRAGTTVVFASDGTVRYVIAKPLPSVKGLNVRYESQRVLAACRREGFLDYVGALDDQDPLRVWGDEKYEARRMVRRAQLTAAHVNQWSRRPADD
jgi:hypothetical protein